MARPPALIQGYARIGAQIRLAEVRAEIAAIERAFPDLAARRGLGARPVPAPAAVKAEGQTVRPGESVVRSRRKRKPMPAAQRKAVGERMRVYWKRRRETQSNKKR